MTAKQISVKIISAETTLFEGGAQAIYLPGSLGAFEVLPGHAPIISSLEKGRVSVKKNEREQEEFDINSGLVSLQNDEMTLCVD